MKSRLMIPFALAALYACAERPPTEPIPRAPTQRPLLGTFPGTNGKIVFLSDRFPDGGMLTMTLGDFAAPQTLSPDGSEAQWSPDGTKLVFDSNVDGNPEIYVMNADGSGRTRLTNNPAFDGYPSWSPDGSKIAFTSERVGGGHIYVMDADGNNVVAITNNVGGNNFSPSWSPNGTKIAFTSSRDAANLEIYVMNVDGTNPTNVTNDVQRDYDPSWSPDGSKILFTHEGTNPGDRADIYVMNPDGTGKANLTPNTPNSSEVTAAWSPDGTRILFVTDRDGNSEIYGMWADGSGLPQNLTFNSASDVLPDWQPVPTAPPVCVFGPNLYTRLQGQPQRFVETFSATPGSYTVDIDDLASAGADAIVTLNGVVIMDGRGTTGEVGPRHKVVTVTLLANNTLEINLRGKKGSKLQVKICPTSGSQCYSNLPAPQLTLESTTVDGSFVQFEFDVPNYTQFPAPMFAPAPNLPACGLNTSASRTWVDIYDGNGNYLHGFCSFSSNSDLNLVWLRIPVDQRPAEAYITLTDRQCNTTYTSNRVNLAGGE